MLPFATSLGTHLDHMSSQLKGIGTKMRYFRICLISHKPGLHLVSAPTLLCHALTMLRTLPGERIAESLLPWPGEESLELLCNRVKLMCLAMLDHPKPVPSAPNYFTAPSSSITDVHLPLLFINMNFATYMGNWPPRVDKLHKMTVRFIS